MSAELKPCPFCGRDGILLGDHTHAWVECDAVDCDARTGPKDTPDGAIAAWNRRAQSPSVSDDPLQQLADQAQECDMGYGPNACPTCGKSQPSVSMTDEREAFEKWWDSAGQFNLGDTKSHLWSAWQARASCAPAVPQLKQQAAALQAALRSCNAVAIERGDKFGVCDQIDNTGQPYQSQWLADLLGAAPIAANSEEGREG